MSQIRFDGQVVVITGAGRGLGAAYARLIAALGGAVVVHDAGVAGDGSGFDPSIADDVVSEIVAAGGQAAACYDNLEDQADCTRIVEVAVTHFGRLDALVHNAGKPVASRAALRDRPLRQSGTPGGRDGAAQAG